MRGTVLLVSAAVFGQLRPLAGRFPGTTAADLAQVMRILAPLVRVAPRAVWGKAGQTAYATAESWLGRELHPSPVWKRDKRPVSVEMFAPVSSGRAQEILEEAARLLAFAEPGQAGEVRGI
ncbi:hypothetical protein MTP10_31790 [Nonomuraea sp. 3-1Str]|uniref:hypothetical protein n=1 Tax=Nonomuraea sp. 3-1Str TaxID=2929801 RepID=UPI0028568781|nr:hypothetical protein [Nonomuraea sp. 3-1Str]MDR8413301.1 hypothetical protein [Nonomuraea sp. 3-1Str]